MKNTPLFLFFAFAASTLPAIGAITTGTTPNPHPNYRQISSRIKSEWKEVLVGAKNKKLSPDQGNTLRANLKSIRRQELAMKQQSTDHELTTAQTAQLNGSLDQIQQTLTAASLTPEPARNSHH